jgi:hypothetical protein
MSNTKIEYMYRDGANYKVYRSLVVEGSVSDVQLRECMDDESFIPSQVGLVDLQPELVAYPSDEDHVWHELVEVEPTDDPVNFHLTASELLNNFRNRKGNWSVTEATLLHGL